MSLLHAPRSFDHPDWLFDLKHDGFPLSGFIDGYYCRLVSRQVHEFKRWSQLSEELGLAIRKGRAVLDGEIK
jgi:ATP-dependent DNA ligase